MSIKIAAQAQKGDFELSIDIQIAANRISALFGPSGSGKTSLLRVIAGLEKPARGTIIVNGQVWQNETCFLPPHKRAIGYVFQEASLFDHLSIIENLKYGLKRQARHPLKTAKGSAPGLTLDDAIAFFNIVPLLNRRPYQLSGGERQRVALGRAILSNPEILLLDEPLNGLDKTSASQIIPILKSLHHELSLPMIYVSHDMAEIDLLADDLLLLEAGKIHTTGPLADLLCDPALPFCDQPDAVSILPARLVNWDEPYGLAEFDVAGSAFFLPLQKAPVGERHRLRISASDVALAPARRKSLPRTSILNQPTAIITAIKPYDRHQLSVFLQLGTGENKTSLLSRITLKSWDRLQLEPGNEVHALIKSVALDQNI